MTQWLCKCGFIFTEEKGLSSQNIEPNTKWVDITTYTCPKCKGNKENYEEIKLTTSDEGVPVIEAHYDRIKEWVMDEKGYFTIKIFPEEKLIKVRYYTNDGSLQSVIQGKKSIDIFNTLIREDFISSLQHAADMGAELTKAEICMQLGKEYIQDAILNLQ